MSMNMNVDDSWVPEPELQEAAPRRIAPFTDYPDLNRPNLLIALGVGGALIVGGLVLFALGLSGKNPRFSGIGIALICFGLIAVVYFPLKVRSHLQRCERLVERGVPVIARILSADNLNGDPYARSVRYQVTTLQGELTHRTVNADDRVLPKRIPGNTTALMDMETGDFEIYCALPFRGVARRSPSVVTSQSQLQTPVFTQPQPAPFTPPTAPPQPTGAMGTMQAPAVSEVKREKPKEEEAPKKRETFE